MGGRKDAQRDPNEYGQAQGDPGQDQRVRQSDPM